MRKHFSILIALAALLAASLACNRPVARSRNVVDRMATIDSLAITPAESNGTRPLVLSFGYTVPTMRTTFECSYTGPSGVETTIGGYSTGYDARMNSEPPITDKASMTFNVSAPGKYIAHCWDTMGPASEATSFTITSSAQQPPVKVVITSGGLWFTYENGVAGWCLPGVNYKDYGGTSSLDVAADGILSGKCTMLFGNTQMNSTLGGAWYKDTGEVSFHLKTILIANYTVREGTKYEEKGTSTTIYEYEDKGNGKMLSEYQAGGDASYTLTCTTTNPKAIGCNPPSTGTVHWVINFNAP